MTRSASVLLLIFRQQRREKKKEREHLLQQLFHDSKRRLSLSRERDWMFSSRPVMRLTERALMCRIGARRLGRPFPAHQFGANKRMFLAQSPIWQEFIDRWQRPIIHFDSAALNNCTVLRRTAAANGAYSSAWWTPHRHSPHPSIGTIIAQRPLQCNRLLLPFWHCARYKCRGDIFLIASNWVAVNKKKKARN